MFIFITYLFCERAFKQIMKNKKTNWKSSQIIYKTRHVLIINSSFSFGYRWPFIIITNNPFNNIKYIYAEII